jgi:acyl-CoA reductase-like NAD-dependent aldehyde dehydrogenase
MSGPALTSLVGGRPREGEEVVPDINPAATDERVATVTLAGPKIAAEAVEAAATAFTRWRDTPKVNQESAGVEFQAPFGGMRQSSSGSREQGKVARDFFTQWKTVYLDAPPGE